MNYPGLVPVSFSPTRCCRKTKVGPGVRGSPDSAVITEAHGWWQDIKFRQDPGLRNSGEAVEVCKVRILGQVSRRLRTEQRGPQTRYRGPRLPRMQRRARICSAPRVARPEVPGQACVKLAVPQGNAVGARRGSGAPPEAIFLGERTVCGSPMRCGRRQDDRAQLGNFRRHWPYSLSLRSSATLLSLLGACGSRDRAQRTSVFRGGAAAAAG